MRQKARDLFIGLRSLPAEDISNDYIKRIIDTPYKISRPYIDVMIGYICEPDRTGSEDIINYLAKMPTDYLFPEIQRLIKSHFNVCIQNMGFDNKSIVCAHLLKKNVQLRDKIKKRTSVKLVFFINLIKFKQELCSSINNLKLDESFRAIRSYYLNKGIERYRKGSLEGFVEEINCFITLMSNFIGSNKENYYLYYLIFEAYVSIVLFCESVNNKDVITEVMRLIKLNIGEIIEYIQPQNIQYVYMFLGYYSYYMQQNSIKSDVNSFISNLNRKLKNYRGEYDDSFYNDVRLILKEFVDNNNESDKGE